MVDTLVLGTSVERREGSSPSLGTYKREWRNGRRAILRGWCLMDVRVRIPPRALNKSHEDDNLREAKLS